MSVAVHIPLWRAAHGRTGDKGNRSNISVIAWSEALYPFGCERWQSDAARVKLRCSASATNARNSRVDRLICISDQYI